MKIKPTQRVIYTKNPLVEVICQIRFDRLPELDEVPVGLREEFASNAYPNEFIEQPSAIQFGFEHGVGVSSVQSLPKVFHYRSAEPVQAFSLSTEFLSFSTSTYTTWEDFQRDFFAGLNAFASRYPKVVVRRVGLRYKDLIEREGLGLAGVPWRELVTPLVAGAFASTELFDDPSYLDASVEQQSSQVLIKLDGCNLLLQTALLKSNDTPPKQAVLIDSDFYVDSDGVAIMDEGSLRPLLTTLHDGADGIFRHCIQEKLHVALNPRSVKTPI